MPIILPNQFTRLKVEYGKIDPFWSAAECNPPILGWNEAMLINDEVVLEDVGRIELQPRQFEK